MSPSLSPPATSQPVAEIPADFDLLEMHPVVLTHHRDLRALAASNQRIARESSNGASVRGLHQFHPRIHARQQGTVVIWHMNFHE